MAYRQPLATKEWYHCYNRGVDKRVVFKTRKDYERFLSLMYICNGTKKMQISDRRDTSLQSILTDNFLDRGESLTSLGAYALMPNHVHFIFQETIEGGTVRFIQRVFTGYTMYFNKKYSRTGGLFAGPFKSRHIADDCYLKQVLPYVLLNPLELFEPRWKTGISNLAKCEKKLLEYPYSSLPDLFGNERLERKVLGDSLYTYYDSIPRLKKMLQAAQKYHREHPDL